MLFLLPLLLVAELQAESAGDFDIEIPASEFEAIGSASLDRATGDLVVPDAVGGFTWGDKVPSPGRYQVWVLHYCEGDNTAVKVEVNSTKQVKRVINMANDKISRFNNAAGKRMRFSKGLSQMSGITPEKEPYYFREYLGTHVFRAGVGVRLTYKSDHPVKVHQLEIVKEGRYPLHMEELLFAGIDFYVENLVPDGLVPCLYDAKKDKSQPLSSIAVCGLGLMAISMNHELDRDPLSKEKALQILRTVNGKNPKVQIDRHSSGLFKHFLHAVTGKSKSEFSTIDTSILVCGALFARNTFDDPAVKAEADELWNSIDWSQCVVSTDPSQPRFYLSGQQMDGTKTGTISMYNEYIILAYLCQKYEDQKRGGKARKNIMPDLHQLPRSVYKNRVMVANRIHPSFLVQFPFYMTELGQDELFFSFTGAQAQADRATGMSRNGGDRTAWGVSPGTTPDSAYLVDTFVENTQNVMRPRIVAGFIPVLPKAAEDLYERYKNPENRKELAFGTILPGFIPGNDEWHAWRLPGVDFCSLMFGMAANHPKLGMKFYKEKTKFTFEP